MKLLLVSDLHYALKQFDWTTSVAPDFDVVIIAGDHLDVSGQLDGGVQIVVILKYLNRLSDYLFVLGRYTEGQRSSATDVLPFLAAWDSTSPWSVCAFGPTEALCMTAAMGLGGHVRVGFENNLQRADGSTALNNADLVSNVAAIARHSGRGVAGLEDALRLYGARAA